MSSAVRNADAIAQVPGVSGFYLGASGDLSADLGVTTSHPDVDVHVAALRKKLEINVRAPVHIITVRKTGYRFEG